MDDGHVVVTGSEPRAVRAPASSTDSSALIGRRCRDVDESGFDNVVGVHPNPLDGLDPRALRSDRPPVDLVLSIAFPRFDVASIACRQPELDERRHAGQHTFDGSRDRGRLREKDGRLEAAFPNPPTITSGKVIAHQNGVATTSKH